MISKQKIIYTFISKIEKIFGVYWTYWIRPIKQKNITRSNDCYSDESVAIVLQGPIIIENDFTYETLCLYRKKFPRCRLIVSTWDDTDTSVINRIKTVDGVQVITSTKPIPGRGNINMQKVSTLAGIQCAADMGCKYLLKTRTDHRIYGDETIAFCIKLLEKFPAKGNINARGRLITTNMGTFKSRLYNICDMFIFGYLDDVYRYFNAPTVDNLPDGFRYDESDMVEYAKARPGEIHFTVNYLEQSGHNITWTIEDSDYIRNNYFIVVDNSSLDILWPKYDHKEYRWKSYDKDFNLQQCSFSEWVSNQE